MVFVFSPAFTNSLLCFSSSYLIFLFFLYFGYTFNALDNNLFPFLSQFQQRIQIFHALLLPFLHNLPHLCKLAVISISPTSPVYNSVTELLTGKKNKYWMVFHCVKNCKNPIIYHFHQAPTFSNCDQVIHLVYIYSLPLAFFLHHQNTVWLVFFVLFCLVCLFLIIQQDLSSSIHYFSCCSFP